MRTIQLSTGNFYHIYNRGVEKRQIFYDSQDYCRFIHNLYELNDLKHVLNIGRRFSFHDGLPEAIMKRERELLAEVHCFSIMPNHYHLILRQIQEQGISKFMHKLGMAYALFFNQKYSRKGVLFEGRFKAKTIEKDEYLIHLSRYIHLNPLNLFQSDWKERGVADWKSANAFLKSYRWSSYLDYIGIKNFPSVIKTDFVLGYFGKESRKEYKNFVNDWALKDMEQINELIK